MEYLLLEQKFDLLMGSVGHNSAFSELVHVAYQIQGNQDCSNTANILPTDPPNHPPTLGMGSIVQNSTLSEHGPVAYQIKENHEMQQHGSKYFAHRPLPTCSLTLGIGVKRSKFNFF